MKFASYLSWYFTLSLVVFALLASTLEAQESRIWSGSSVTLVPADGQGGHLADIHLVNALNQGLQQDTFTLVVGNLAVDFMVSETPGNSPDTFIVVGLPDGVIALPAQITLEEFQNGTIELFLLTDMAMS